LESYYTMKSWVHLAPLFILVAALQGGSNQAVPGVDPRLYPPDKFQVTQEKHVLGDITLKVVQIKKNSPNGEEPRFCRAWVEAWKRDNLFKRVDYNDIDPRDASFGIFVPKEQPSSQYLIAVKEGDGDPRVLLMGVDGSFNDIAGGLFLVTADKRKLITQTTPEGGAVSAFDLAKGELVLDGADVPRIHTWHKGRSPSGYFFTEVGPSEDEAHPVEEQAYAYAPDFRQGAVVKFKLLPAELLRSPRVKLDFDPRKLPNCTSQP
jgi:hypothetical protein